MPKTLLLADDSVTIQKVVGISFASEDIQLVTVDNGTAALAKAREIQPDIVLADVVMPGLNGYEVCRQIKADPKLRHVPVLLLTGTFEAFDENRARDAGSDGHITKPFEAQALVDLVNAKLAASAPPRAPEAPPASSAVGSSPLFGEEEEPFDFMSEEVTEPSGARSEPALADDALSFGSADDLDLGAKADGQATLEVEALTQAALADADSGIAALDEHDDENAETLPPVEADPFENATEAPAATQVLFGAEEPAAEPPATSDDVATRVFFSGEEQAPAPAPTPSQDPFADLIGGERSAPRAAMATDLGDPFADDEELAPAPNATVVLAAAADDSDLFGPAEADDETPTSRAIREPLDADPAALMPGREELHNLLEKMAWEAFGDVTDRIVRETVAKVEQIAWEVIPKMAETLIREEIRKLKESDE